MTISVRFNTLLHESGKSALLNVIMEAFDNSKLRVSLAGGYKKDFNYIKMQALEVPIEHTNPATEVPTDAWISLSPSKRCKFVVRNFKPEDIDSSGAFVFPAYNLDYQYKAFRDVLKKQRVLDLDFWENGTTMLLERLPFGISADIDVPDGYEEWFNDLDVITCENEMYIRDSYEPGSVSLEYESGLTESVTVRLYITDFGDIYKGIPVCTFVGCQAFRTLSGDNILRVSEDAYRSILGWLACFRIIEESCIYE